MPPKTSLFSNHFKSYFLLLYLPLQITLLILIPLLMSNPGTIPILSTCFIFPYALILLAYAGYRGYWKWLIALLSESIPILLILLFWEHSLFWGALLLPIARTGLFLPHLFAGAEISAFLTFMNPHLLLATSFLLFWAFGLLGKKQKNPNPPLH